jgi:Leucine Rich repeat
MVFRIGKMFVLFVTPLACWLFVAMAGCSRSGPESALPPQQAAAFKAMKDLNAKVAVRNGEVVYVDFYGMQDAASAVVHLKSFPHLEKLNFSSTNMTDEALVHLVELSDLKELALNRTQVTDKGLVHLAGLSNLEILNFNEDDVTDAGLVHLQNLKKLKQLHLNQTKVSDAALEHLSGLERLETLLVYGTPVTAGGAAKFRERHPDTEVVVTEDGNDAGSQREKE